MSIKIYNGIKFNSSNIESVFKELLAAKEIIYECGHNEIDSITLRIALDDCKQTHWSSRRFHLEKKMKELSINSMNHLNCEIVIYPYQGKLYGHINTNCKKYIHILNSMNIFKEYSYWNNSEKPKKISANEWNKRNDIWRAIIEIKNGLHFSLFSSEDLFDEDRLIEKIKLIN